MATRITESSKSDKKKRKIQESSPASQDGSDESVVEELLKQYETYKTQFEEWTTKNKGNVSQEAYEKYVADFRSWEKVVLGQIKSATKKHHHKSKKRDKKRSRGEKARDEVEVQETKPLAASADAMSTAATSMDPLAMMMTMAMMMMPMMAQQQQQQSIQPTLQQQQLPPPSNPSVATGNFLGVRSQQPPPLSLPPAGFSPMPLASLQHLQPPLPHFISSGSASTFVVPPSKPPPTPLPDLSRPPPASLGTAPPNSFAVSVKRPFGAIASPQSIRLPASLNVPPPSLADEFRMRRDDSLTTRAERDIKRDFDDFWYNKFQLNQQVERGGAIQGSLPMPPHLGFLGPSSIGGHPTTSLPSLVGGLQFTSPPSRFSAAPMGMAGRHGPPLPAAHDFGGSMRPLMDESGVRRTSADRRDNRSVSPRRRSPERFGRSKFGPGSKDFSMRRRDNRNY